MEMISLTTVSNPDSLEAKWQTHIQWTYGQLVIF